MKFNISGIKQGPGLDQFKSDWIDFTSHENRMILDDGRISEAQLLVINLFCGNDEGYKSSESMTINTLNHSQSELEALFRARGRALASLMQREPMALATEPE